MHSVEYITLYAGKLVCIVKIELGNTVLKFATQRTLCISRILNGNGKCCGHSCEKCIESTCNTFTELIVCLGTGTSSKYFYV